MSWGGRDPGEQRDLRVVLLARERDAVLDRPGAVPLHDLLLGHGEPHASAGALELQAPLPHLLEQRRDLRGHVVVRVLRDAAHLGSPDVGGGELAGPVELERPHHRRAPLAGQQARRALRQHGRVERDLAVGRVDGERAIGGLGVERAARRHERAHVGDRVPDPVAVPERLDVHRLVEVRARPGGSIVTNGTSRGSYSGGRGRRGLGLGLSRVRERLGHARLGANGVEPHPAARPRGRRGCGARASAGGRRYAAGTQPLGNAPAGTSPS
jgi:hypothetical protein